MSLFAHSFVCVYCALFALFSFFAFCARACFIVIAIFFHVPRNVKINWRNSWEKTLKKRKRRKQKPWRKKTEISEQRPKEEPKKTKTERNRKDQFDWGRIFTHFVLLVSALFFFLWNHIVSIFPFCFFFSAKGCFVWCFTMLACSSRNSLLQHTTLDNAIPTWPSELLVACHCRVRQLLVASHCWLRLSTHSFRLQQFP